MAKSRKLKVDPGMDCVPGLEGVLSSPLTRTKVSVGGYNEGDRIPLDYVIPVWTGMRVLSRPQGPRTNAFAALITHLRSNMCLSMYPRRYAAELMKVVLRSTPELSPDTAEMLWDMSEREDGMGAFSSSTIMDTFRGGGSQGPGQPQPDLTREMTLDVHKRMLVLLASSVLPTEEWCKLLLMEPSEKAYPSVDGMAKVQSELRSLLPKRACRRFTRAAMSGGLNLERRPPFVIPRGQLADALISYAGGIRLAEAAEEVMSNVVGGILFRAYEAAMSWLMERKALWEGSAMLKRIREVAEAHRLSPEEMHVLVLVLQWDHCAGWLMARKVVPTCYSKGRVGVAPGPVEGGDGSQGAARPGTRAHISLTSFLTDVLWTARAGGASKAKGVNFLAESRTFSSVYLDKTRGSLIRKGVLEAHCPEADHPGSYEVTVDPRVKGYITGEILPGAGGYSSSVSCLVPLDGALPLDRHGLKVQKEEALLSTIRRGMTSTGKGTHVLLHGLPGSGKTELAKSLARHLGGQLSQPASGLSAADDLYQVPPIERLRMLRTLSMNRLPGDIVLVDEADRTLNCGTEVSIASIHNSAQAPKELINEFLDTAQGAYIWIVNATWWIPPSIMRRFDYVLKASLPGQEARCLLAETIAGREGLSSEGAKESLASVAREYPLTPAGIMKLAKVLAEDANVSKGVLEEVAMSHLDSSEHSVGWKRDRIPGQSGGSYDPSFVNVSEGSYPLEELEARARRFLGLSEERKKSVGLQNLNVLLYGPPGTGKTEWARHLAGALRRPLVEVSATSLMDKYVGGTEENIRRAFSSAEEREAILLIDEADAVLGSRESAEKSWEVSQVEQFLYSMENYKGILVCTTNFEDHLDKALLRRFYASLRFGYMKQDAVHCLLERSLRSLGIEEHVDEDSLRVLRGLSLTPSDFGKACRVLALAEEISQSALVATVAGAARSREGTRRLGL